MLRDDSRTEISNPFKLRSKIDSRFPLGNLVRYLIADSFDLTKVSAFCRKDLLRFLKNFQQFAQPHRPHGRQHIERDAGVSRVHVRSRASVPLPSLSKAQAGGSRYFKTEFRLRLARPVQMVSVVR